MITLTSVDRKPMRFNPNLIAVMNEIELFAAGNEIISVVALWAGGDKPFYVRETIDQINALISR